MQINVTAEDIRDGQRTMCSHCPVAIAIRRAIQDAIGREKTLTSDSVGVGEKRVWVSFWRFGLFEKAFDLPRGVRWRISRFDVGGQMRPFQFELSDLDVFLAGITAKS